MKPAVANAVAILVACAVGGCNDGAISLTSGLQPGDAAIDTANDATVGASDDGGSGAVSDAGADGTVAAIDSGGDASHGCATDQDCPLASLHCDVPSGLCVPCVNDQQCTAPGLPRCDVAANRCVACGVSADCPDGGVCDPTSRACFTPCNDGGCRNDDLLCDSRGYCVGCTSDAGGCAANAVCDDGTGACGECERDSQCTSAALPRCNHQTDRCVQCLVSTDCPSTKPVCDPSTWTCLKP